MAALGVSFYPQGLSYADIANLGKLAEDRGFDSVFAVEAGASNDVMATVQAVALSTHCVTIGTGIANLYLRHPALLGAGAVAIDELSGGRLILGIGVNNARMISALGLTWRDPRQALRDTTALLRAVFSGGNLPGMHTPLRLARHHIPIHLAGVALETAALAGEIADGLMLYLASRSRYQQVVQHMTQSARCTERDPQDVMVSLLIPAFISEDFEAARAAARRFLSFYVSVPVYTKMFSRSGFHTEVDEITQALERDDRAGVAAAVSDQLMDEVCLVGPGSRCQEQLIALREAGVAYPILAPQAVNEQPMAAAERLIKAFGPGNGA